MAIHSDSSIRPGWNTAARCLLLITGLAIWTGSSTARDPLEKVEVWQGNKRINLEPTPPTPSRPATPVAPVAPVAPVWSGEANGEELPPVRLDPIPPPPKFVVPAESSSTLPRTSISDLPPNHPASKPQVRSLGEQLIRSTGLLAEECQSAIEACAATVRAGGDRVKDSLATINATPTKSRFAQESALAPNTLPPLHTGTVELVDRTPGEKATEISPPLSALAWVQLALGAAAVLVPLGLVLGLAIVLRRGGLQLRVEVVSNGSGGFPLVARLDQGWQQAPGTGSAPVGTGTELSPVSEPSPESVPEEEPPTGESFDLGPSYEEEQAAKATSIMLQEQAVLQEIFEQNLRLQEEIGKLQPETRPESEPAPESSLVQDGAFPEYTVEVSPETSEEVAPAVAEESK